MAIEIKQLSIRSNVVQRAAYADDPGNPGSQAEQDALPGAPSATLDRSTRAALLEECRAMVIELLRRREER
ncbi:DUF5908 family protein [Herbaspirillum seropedicae]|uniref:DUF5908 family protein n=1 Tax=Herbaspirillum seropedicae TaxID=964 RepID=UPI00285BE89A|nr:DUF5908 family protein [Herbaspirillum seropedicae]MDR6394213.1 hypothetical protein [Herbaspirillum seropedicae]